MIKIKEIDLGKSKIKLSKKTQNIIKKYIDEINEKNKKAKFNRNGV